MHLVVNGDEVVLPAPATVTDLLTHLELGPTWVIVEYNGEPLERSRFPTTTLAEGDRVELVRAVAGG